ncbi:3-methyl-2-oxobutanoate hydroxymethyltransferase [Helcobacillus massiliensis]|uniref:3-methyl-2-oxobutanoate hydroxymethyltransferase n=1 Tax=Helcobacillus massiliensis TaxID=521392 RepID=UPI00255732DF|nr:3-methyl-2-oxobutanoate hydroxymethyltransferase [Helcobacillus massiliensis]MDK7741193.1 3-methyl-2-oxobutanoate hydroxymethyltransferase [Helcobacillus massiliensis]WOO93999.1 3-methyl-2-oxobutanoate hydroxymethyltransferase [Helcobacillus massiliensis]
MTAPESPSPRSSVDAAPPSPTGGAGSTGGATGAGAPEQRRSPRRVRTLTLQDFKEQGRKFSMLTSYDALTAAIFDDAGVDVLLVGDSAGNVVLGYEATASISHEAMQLFTGAVARSVTRPLVIADLAFGTYEVSEQQAVASGIDLVRAGAHAVKLEGGVRSASRIRALVDAGVAVCGHIGFTPQSVNQLGGNRVQGRGDEAAERLLADARAVQKAGAFAVVLEMVPAALAERVSAELTIPTIGIGAGAGCDGQVLVWQDMAGLSGFSGRFVKQYAQLRETLGAAAGQYADEVRAGTFPDADHAFD